MKLEGKVAIVTGAGRGIGKAIALRLARDGADLLLGDLDEATVAETANEVRALGRKAHSTRLDVSNKEQANALGAMAVKELGRIDILVNNAGTQQVKPWTELNDADIDRMYAVNIKSVFFCTQGVERFLREQQSGRIINLASLAAKLGRPNFLHYSSSKAAVVNVTRGLADYFAKYNVTCNSVCPGIVDTKMWEYIDQELVSLEGRAKKGDALEARRQTIPLGRLEQAEDVADVIAFLASDDSRYITGQSIQVDGGIFME